MREFRKKISSAPSLSPYLLVEIHGFSSKEVLENSKIYGETWPEGVFVLSLEELYLSYTLVATMSSNKGSFY